MKEKVIIKGHLKGNKFRITKAFLRYGVPFVSIALPFLGA